MTDKKVILNTATLAKITLNAPKKLNALDLDMCNLLGNALGQWQQDKSVKAVLITGAGEKAFCAGGDVVGVCEQGKTDIQKACEFFWSEYRTNWRVKNLSKPYIAFIDGIVMGGGVGVSVHGHYRIATERTMLAMPETMIGFFPDVGGTYFLSRLPNNMGMFLGLTGHRVYAADLLQLGIATHYIHSTKLAELEQKLATADYSADAFATVEQILNQYCSQPDAGKLAAITDQVDRLFSADSLTQLMQNLTDDNSQFADRILSTLAKMSPTSLAVTFEQIKTGKAMNFDQVMQTEMRMAWHMMQQPDFTEGVRALLVDKDKTPHWQPDQLAVITPDMVQNYFNPIDNELFFDWDKPVSYSG
ncbi:MAG: enoyl-CoA hydratase/isomerase family protein [Rhizobiales bacterium]|nr:enoyl-CoA hydratase/isomerase family protein [Hyphomicrobiales bacterium]NRB13028.1 enoyl-CoA hydratase/isomerase family protein [Hyphomicrobiales bacterium]